MSLKEAYNLAHIAQCKLNLEASRPDRNLRIVVGNLMHYESLRLRIVEIEHQTWEKRRATQAKIDHTFQHKPATSQPLGPKPSPGTQTADENEASIPGSDEYDELIIDDDDDNDNNDDDDANDDDLSLSRFPSGASRPQPPPDLEPDDSSDDDYDEDFWIDYSQPEEPDEGTLERAIKGEESELVASMYDGVRNCPCHGQSEDAPSFERMWELPADAANPKSGVTRAVGQVRDREAVPRQACTIGAKLTEGVPVATAAS